MKGDTFIVNSSSKYKNSRPTSNDNSNSSSSSSTGGGGGGGSSRDVNSSTNYDNSNNNDDDVYFKEVDEDYEDALSAGDTQRSFSRSAGEMEMERLALERKRELDEKDEPKPLKRIKVSDEDE